MKTEIHPLIRKSALLAATFALTVSFTTQAESPRKHRTYEVKITNMTKSLKFTPIIASTHSINNHFFTVGEPASKEVADIAEGGDTTALKALLESSRGVSDIKMTDGLLEPGKSVSFKITAKNKRRRHKNGARFSLMAMLLPTNDTFVALNAVQLPKYGSISYDALAYDSGTERNDELCMNIPGPTCNGTPFSDPSEDDEGFIYVGNGIHGQGDLQAFIYDWNNPVARVTITRLP